MLLEWLLVVVKARAEIIGFFSFLSATGRITNKAETVVVAVCEAPLAESRRFYDPRKPGFRYRRFSYSQSLIKMNTPKYLFHICRRKRIDENEKLFINF